MEVEQEVEVDTPEEEEVMIIMPLAEGDRILHPQAPISPIRVQDWAITQAMGR